MTKTLLSFGHGYSAQALARKLVPRGWRIIGTTRSSEKADTIRSSGVTPWIEQGGCEPAGLDDVTHLLISAGPTKEGDPIMARHRDRVMTLIPKLQWVGYLSTTGVYGDHQGGWVDETTPLSPSTRRGQWRQDAEAAWAAIPGLPLHIFRLAGIYGPGRGPFAKVQNGTARRIIKDGQVFSRIHVDDIVQVLEASIAQPNPGAIYNVCDNDPAPPQEVIAYAAGLLGLPVPPATKFEQAELTPMARSFYAENKRVRNDRIKTELGVELLYPTYRDGLNALKPLG